MPAYRLPGDAPDGAEGWALLTPAQQDVAALVASLGASDQEIRRLTGRSTQTIKTHLHTIYERLGFPEPKEGWGDNHRCRLVRWCWGLPEWPEIDRATQARYGSFESRYPRSVALSAQRKHAAARRLRESRKR